MYGECKKCDENVSSLMDWDTLADDYIECPKCGHKMTVCYEEIWDEESENQEEYWWLEDYVT